MIDVSFYTDMSANKDSFTSSNLYGFFFSYLITLARAYSKMLNGNDGSKHSSLVFSVMEKDIISPFSIRLASSRFDSWDRQIR